MVMGGPIKAGSSGIPEEYQPGLYSRVLSKEPGGGKDSPEHSERKPLKGTTGREYAKLLRRNQPMANNDNTIGAIGSVGYQGRTQEIGTTRASDVSGTPAAPGEAPAPQAEPEDTFEPGAAPLLSRKEIEEKSAAGAQKDKIIDSMISRDTKIGAPDAKAVEELRGTLSKVDTEVLRYNQENGTRFVIVKEGQDLMDTGVIRKQDAAAINAQAPELGKKGQAVLNGAEGEYGPKIKELEDQIARSPMKKDDSPFAFAMNGNGMVPENPEEHGRLQKELLDMRGKEREKAADQLEKEAGDKVKIFSAADGMKMGGGMMGAMGMLMVSQMPLSTDDMARTHGAKTPEEMKQFTDSVEKLNGDRLPKLRQEFITQQEQVIAGMTDPAQKKQALEQLEKMEQNPGTIPIDHAKNMVLVPNTYYYRPGDKPDAAPTVVDTHDYVSLRNWSDETGKIEKEGDSSTLGQHFYKDGLNTIVIRDTALGDRSPIHEMGHSTDSILRKKSPGFAAELDTMGQTAFSNISILGQGENKHESVTSYAGTNKNENMAEGFGLYYFDPKRLQAKDPELYAIIQKEVGFIKEQ